MALKPSVNNFDQQLFALTKAFDSCKRFTNLLLVKIVPFDFIASASTQIKLAKKCYQPNLSPTLFTGHRSKTYPPGAYVPFGLGHRMCAGYHLAMREMKTIVCELLTNFDIKLVTPDEMITESSTIFLTRSKDEIRLRLVPSATSTLNNGEKGKENIGDNCGLDEKSVKLNGL